MRYHAIDVRFSACFLEIMMKKICWILMVVWTFGIILIPGAYSQTENRGPAVAGDFDRYTLLREARGLANQYFLLLKRGDTQGVHDLLGGTFLKKRKKHLKFDSSYGNFVASRYRNANFHIKKVDFINENKLAVDVLILFDKGSIQKHRLIIGTQQNHLKILGEEEPLI